MCVVTIRLFTTFLSPLSAGTCVKYFYSGVIELQTGRALHRLDAVLESVVVFRVASRAVAEVVVPFGFAEAGFFPRRRIGSRRPNRVPRTRRRMRASARVAATPRVRVSLQSRIGVVSASLPGVPGTQKYQGTQIVYEYSEPP